MRGRSISNVSIQMLAVTAAASLGMATPTRHRHHHDHVRKSDSEGFATTDLPATHEHARRDHNVDKDFPDGEIDCSDFPSDYGPIDVEWAKLGGWTGIQYVTIEGDQAVDIVTANPGDECKAGAMCSYACPPGYQKSQWPSAQGAAGESVGGLQCSGDGKLVLTNPDLSTKLCIKGTGQALVKNKLSNNAAICRTDYPGQLSLPPSLILANSVRYRE